MKGRNHMNGLKRKEEVHERDGSVETKEGKYQMDVVQEISYLGDYNKSFQPNYDKIHLSPLAEKHDTDRTKSAGNLVKQCQARVCYTQAVNSGKHREINQHP